jgi:hypothetical protein
MEGLPYLVIRVPVSFYSQAEEFVSEGRDAASVFVVLSGGRRCADGLRLCHVTFESEPVFSLSP